MTSSGEQEQRLQGEIQELRGELGETVEALAHKADVPGRAKERGNELRDQAVERGVELRDQAVERGLELRERVAHSAEQARERAIHSAEQARERAAHSAERARDTARQTMSNRWVMLAGAGAALIALIALIRRCQAR